jgi:hypothetical protein
MTNKRGKSKLGVWPDSGLVANPLCPCELASSHLKSSEEVQGAKMQSNHNFLFVYNSFICKVAAGPVILDLPIL